MASWNVNVSDYGYTCRLVLQQDGVTQDISSYGTKQMLFTSPAGTETTKTAQFDTDGTDGALTYTVADGDIAAVGIWEVRARISKTGVRLTSDRQQMIVEA